MPRDGEAVHSLLQASYPVLMAPAYDENVLAPALELMTKANVSLLASGTYYVAEARGGLVVGCGGWTFERPGTAVVEAKLGHLRHFGTHPAWLYRGVGRAIYGVCESNARSAGVATFECYSSLNAEVFYQALGFESVRRIDLQLAQGVILPSVLMRREI
jgi:N-acetylglutamate synthase-like GNAT family acetyltransferase